MLLSRLNTNPSCHHLNTLFTPGHILRAISTQPILLCPIKQEVCLTQKAVGENSAFWLKGKKNDSPNHLIQESDIHWSLQVAIFLEISWQFFEIENYSPRANFTDSSLPKKVSRLKLRDKNRKTFLDSNPSQFSKLTSLIIGLEFTHLFPNSFWTQKNVRNWPPVSAYSHLSINKEWPRAFTGPFWGLANTKLKRKELLLFRKSSAEVDMQPNKQRNMTSQRLPNHISRNRKIIGTK